VKAHQGGVYTLVGADGKELSRRRTRDTLRVHKPLVPTGGGTKEARNEFLAAPTQTSTKQGKKSKRSDDNHYEVERVLNHEWNNKLKTQRFYVKWKGYPDSDNSWVKQGDFDDVAVIKRYWKSVNTKAKEQKGPKTKASSTLYKKRNTGKH
jgi:hypothetical protein